MNVCICKNNFLFFIIKGENFDSSDVLGSKSHTTKTIETCKEDGDLLKWVTLPWFIDFVFITAVKQQCGLKLWKGVQNDPWGFLVS